MDTALLALVAVLQRFAKDIYAIFTRDEALGTALIPVLISFTIAIVSLPFVPLSLVGQVRAACRVPAFHRLTSLCQESNETAFEKDSVMVV